MIGYNGLARKHIVLTCLPLCSQLTAFQETCTVVKQDQHLRYEA